MLAVGAELLALLDEPKTVSRLWEEFQEGRMNRFLDVRTITYDWFVLTLDLLYTLQAVEIERGLLKKVAK
jgi:hypothetical protein